MGGASSPDGDHSSPTRDLFDDIWGDDGVDDGDNHSVRSALDQPPPNVTTTPTLAASDSLGETQHRQHHHRHHHPSDIPRLQQEHTTTGFREGLVHAKARSVQAGFDEGFGLGATLGSCAGRLLGVLEGLVAATQHSGGGDGLFYMHGRRLERLLAEARRELGTEGIFAPAYWAVDGTWTYEVKALSGGGGGGDSKEGSAAAGEEMVFEDVAAAHPLIRKYEALVGAEADRWGIKWDVLDDDVVREGVEGGEAGERRSSWKMIKTGDTNGEGGEDLGGERDAATTAMGEGPRPVARKQLDW